MNNNIEIRVGDKTFKEFTSFTLVKSMMALSGAIIFEVLDFTEDNKKYIYIGDSFSVFINGTQAMIGEIETIQYKYTGKQGSLLISGRDNGLLVDSCWGRKPNEWKNLTIRNIVAELCAPFNVTAISEDSALSLSNTVVKSFSVSGKEKVGDAIKRICVENCIIPFSNGDGNLYLTAGTLKNFSPDTIRKSNILEGLVRDTSVDRYGKYVVKGFGYPDQNKSLSDFVQPSSEVTDSQIDVNKTLVILNDIETDSGKCTSRAYFEKNLKAAFATAEDYVIKDFVQSNNKPWDVNYIVTSSDYLGENSSKLICEIRLKYNKDSQYETKLTIVHRDAFSTKNVQIKGKFSR
jgi:prophage tail gpP-like protein